MNYEECAFLGVQFVEIFNVEAKASATNDAFQREWVLVGYFSNGSRNKV